MLARWVTELDRRLQHASSIAAAPGTGGLTNEERSRRNQEVAELASELNLAATHEEEGSEHGEENEVDDILAAEDDIEEMLQQERPPEENARRLAEQGRATAREGVRRLRRIGVARRPMTGPYADLEGSHGGSIVDIDSEHDELSS